MSCEAIKKDKTRCTNPVVAGTNRCSKHKKKTPPKKPEKQEKEECITPIAMFPLNPRAVPKRKTPSGFEESICESMKRIRLIN